MTDFEKVIANIIVEEETFGDGQTYAADAARRILAALAVAERHPDTERLNWLEARIREGAWSVGNTVAGGFYVSPGVVPGRVYANTLRAAIDKATEKHSRAADLAAQKEEGAR